MKNNNTNTAAEVTYEEILDAVIDFFGGDDIYVICDEAPKGYVLTTVEEIAGSLEIWLSEHTEDLETALKSYRVLSDEAVKELKEKEVSEKFLYMIENCVEWFFVQVPGRALTLVCDEAPEGIVHTTKDEVTEEVFTYFGEKDYEVESSDVYKYMEKKYIVA